MAWFSPQMAKTTTPRPKLPKIKTRTTRGKKRKEIQDKAGNHQVSGAVR